MTLKFSIFSLLLITLFSCEVKKTKDYSLAKQHAISELLIENGDTVSIQELIARNGLKGLSVAVIDDYKIIWSDAWGVKYDTIPLDINTSFSTASIAKPVTATLFAILEEQGLINLKQPVNDYLKRWKIPRNKFNEDIDITLEHLLSHTAGTTQGGFIDFYEGDKIPTILESIKGEIPRSRNRAVEIVFEPGSNWAYSGGGYTIAMMALEDHLGSSIEELAQKYIFDPLKLKNTSMVQPKGNFVYESLNDTKTVVDTLYKVGSSTNLAKAHDKNGNIIRTGVPITPQISASGLWSTPTDLCNFLIEIQKALNGLESKLISEEVAKRVTDIVTLKVMRGWSLGWERRYAYGNLDWFSHGGSNTGVGGHMYATMKEGKGIVILGNGPNSVRIPVINSLRDNIIRTHNWGSKYEWNNKKEIPTELISKIEGRYEDLTFRELFEIKNSDGKLYIPRFWNGVRNDLIYIGDNTFITNEVPGQFKFVFNKESTQIQFSRKGAELAEIMYEKVIGKLPNEIALEGDYSAALKAYKELFNKNPQHPLVRESTLNNFGYQQLNQDNLKVALIIFKINAELYPQSANAYDSLAEAYMIMGDKINAIKFYKKSLEFNPDNANAKKYIKEMSSTK